jgi:hypothetical protein
MGADRTVFWQREAELSIVVQQMLLLVLFLHAAIAQSQAL